MKDKEKQIEEIENMIDDYLQGLMGGSELTLAKKIYEKILPKHSVVLSREEYDEFLRQNFIIDELKDCVKLAKQFGVEIKG